MDQTCQDFEIHVVVDVEGRGAGWARNRGAARAAGSFLLFSDADIIWDRDALHVMHGALEADPGAAYSYGGYRIIRDGTASQEYANEPWDLVALRHRNLVSTMALMRRAVFPGFDESLSRLQDWDLWLGMALNGGHRGRWVGRTLFKTPYRAGGITNEGDDSYRAAWLAVRRKYGLPR